MLVSFPFFTSLFNPRSKKSSTAFSLIELLLVIALIGLLSVFALPNMTKLMAESQGITCGNNLRMIEAAKEAYFSDNPTGTLSSDSAQEELRHYLDKSFTFTCPKDSHSNYQIGSRTTHCSCPNKGAKDNQNGHHDLAPVR